MMCCGGVGVMVFFFFFFFWVSCFQFLCSHTQHLFLFFCFLLLQMQRVYCVHGKATSIQNQVQPAVEKV